VNLNNPIMKQRKNQRFYIFISLITIVFTQCGKETIYINEDCNCSSTRFVVHPDHIEFNYLQDTATIEILNLGDEEINWVTSFDTTFFKMPQMSGNLQPDSAYNLNILLKRNEIEHDSLYKDIEFTINEDSLVDIICFIYNYPYEIQSIDRNVVDAVYNQEENLVYVLSTTPYSLNIYSVTDKEYISFDLDEEPYRISYSNELNKIAILSQDHAYIFNLETQEITHTFEIPISPEDVIIADNGWIYICPEHGIYDFLNINIETEESIFSTFYCDGGGFYLHPSGNYIYMNTYGDIVKLNITDGIAVKMYDETIYSSYNKLWGVNDGNHIINGSGKVIALSENEEEDLIEYGDLSHLWSISDVAFSSSNQMVYAIGETEQGGNNLRTTIYCYENQNFIYQANIPAYKYAIPDGNQGYNFYSPDCKYIFAEISGENIIAIAKAEQGSGLYYPYAIQIIKI